MQKLLRKISPKTVCPEVLTRLDIPGAPAEKMLYDVYGVTNKVRTGKGDKGEWIQFKGQFEAVTESGEIFASGAVFLPQPFEDMLYGQLAQAQEADEKATVQFACRVSIVQPTPGKPSATGYEFRCMPLVESTDASPVAALRAHVQEQRKLLAAPKAEASPKVEEAATKETAPARSGRK